MALSDVLEKFSGKPKEGGSDEPIDLDDLPEDIAKATPPEASKAGSNATGKPSDTTPKRRGRPPGSGNATPRATSSGPRFGSKEWAKHTCDTLVATVNQIIIISPLRRDALIEEEMSALSEGLQAEAMSSERIRKWLAAAGTISPHFILANALIAIAVPRLQRRGILPQPTKEQMEAMLRYQREQEEAARRAAYNVGTDGPNGPQAAPVDIYEEQGTEHGIDGDAIARHWAVNGHGTWSPEGGTGAPGITSDSPVPLETGGTLLNNGDNG